MSENETKSETPRTDDAWDALERAKCGTLYVQGEMAKLEIELAIAKAALQTCRDQLEIRERIANFDKARIDWLEKRVEMPHGWHAENDEGERTGLVLWEWPHIDECWNSLRSAIDAARESEHPSKPNN